jgi:Ca2+-binding RTX toxin-like protein
VVGSEKDDIIKLREGDETALGEGGNDTIYVYDGNDTVTGGSGSDTIVISGTVGMNNNNIITDFSITDGDKFDLTAYGITNSTEASALLLQNSNGVILSIDEYVSVLLQDIELAELIASEGWIA